MTIEQSIALNKIITTMILLCKQWPNATPEERKALSKELAIQVHLAPEKFPLDEEKPCKTT